MNKIQSVLVSMNEGKEVKSFPKNTWEINVSNEEVVVSTKSCGINPPKLKLSLVKTKDYSYIKLTGLNLNLFQMLEDLSPASVEKSLFGLQSQVNEKLYEEYDFAVAKNREYLNSTISDLKFANNFIPLIQEDLFN